jgi:hypothetical protein
VPDQFHDSSRNLARGDAIAHDFLDTFLMGPIECEKAWQTEHLLFEERDDPRDEILLPCGGGRF